MFRMGIKLGSWTYVDNNSGSGKKTGQCETIADLLHQHTRRPKCWRGDIGTAEVVDYDANGEIKGGDARLTDHQ